MRPPQQLLIMLTLTALQAVPASEPGSGRVEVHLRSGETVLGLLVGEDAQSVTVRRSMRSRSGTATADIPYQRSDIDEVLDLNQAYLEQAAHAGTSLAAQLAVAHWCADRALNDQAATHAIAVMAIDRGNEEGRGLLGRLGYIAVGMKWVKEDDYLESHGLARYLDRIYSSADKQRIVAVHAAQIAAEALLSDKQQLLDRIQAGIALDQKGLAGDKQKADDLDADSKDKAARMTAAQKTVDDDQKKLDAATKAASAKYGNRRSMGTSPASAQAQKQAQQELSDAKAALAELQAGIDKDKAGKAELAIHDKHLSDEIDAQGRQATALTAEVSALAGEAARTRKATDDAIAHATPVSLPSG